MKTAKERMTCAILLGVTLVLAGLLNVFSHSAPTTAYARSRNDSTVTGAAREARSDTGAQNPVPLINQPLVPDAVAPGGAEFTLTVNGTGFVSGSVVNWSGSPRTRTFVNASQLTAAILASDIATASTASVTVVSPSPGGGTSNVVFFQITTATSSISLNRSDYAVGRSPFAVAVGDFNRDGKLDLTVANMADNTVGVLLGNGNGTFQTPVNYATGGQPNSIAVGDFNGDGKADLALANYQSGTVSVLLGNGDGTFQRHVDYGTGPEPDKVVVGDFNGDGRADLAVPKSLSNAVGVLLGNGDGTFQPYTDYSAGGASVIAVGDFNGDSKLDLAVTDYYSASVSVLLGNGDGTFQAPATYPTGAAANGVLTCDFNGDGKLDLAVANQDSATVSILLGNGDGTFQPRVDFTTSFGPYLLTAGDFNGDGKLDLAASIFGYGGPGNNTVSVLLGNGDGTFQPYLSYPTGSGPISITSGDFNGDGRLDLATANFNDNNTISVLLQATTVALSSTSLKFPDQLVGTTSPAQTVTLTNTGAITLTISGIVATGDFLQTNNCGSSLPAGGSCTIDVSFNPTAKGKRTGALTITDNAAGSPQTVSLTGTGTVVRLSPTIVNFGSQKVGTTSPPQTITLTNTGSTALSIRGIAIAGTDFDDFVETTTCGSSLRSKASCMINVRFRPSATGPRRASLEVIDDGGGSPQRVRLTGTGT